MKKLLLLAAAVVGLCAAPAQANWPAGNRPNFPIVFGPGLLYASGPLYNYGPYYGAAPIPAPAYGVGPASPYGIAPASALPAFPGYGPPSYPAPYGGGAFGSAVAPAFGFNQ